MECEHCNIEMDILPLSKAWRCNKCGRIIRIKSGLERRMEKLGEVKEELEKQAKELNGTLTFGELIILYLRGYRVVKVT